MRGFTQATAGKDPARRPEQKKMRGQVVIPSDIPPGTPRSLSTIGRLRSCLCRGSNQPPPFRLVILPLSFCTYMLTVPGHSNHTHMWPEHPCREIQRKGALSQALRTQLLAGRTGFVFDQEDQL